MVKKRKDGVEIDEVMKLTKVAKSWEFTCSFCFKKFPSAQAMGGHQNAHRSERLEEKRLLVRDPITHRKRAFLQAIKADEAAKNVLGGEVNAAACTDSSVANNNGGENLVMIKEIKSVGHHNPCAHFNLDLTLKLWRERDTSCVQGAINSSL